MIEEEDDLRSMDAVEINILPPDPNFDANDTDEDSGNEEEVHINNLPGSQLRSTAEIRIIGRTDDEEWDEDDLIPLSELAERERRMTIGPKKVHKWTRGNLQNPVLNLEWPQLNTVYNHNSPLELFECFFDAEIIDMFVTCTNQYAASKNRKSDVTPEEMKTFFGILLVSGYCPVPRRRMYWEQAKDSHNAVISEAMCRNRFEHILTNIHCCDNANLDRSDRFAKVRPLFQKINKRFLDFAPVEQNHCVDEAMVPYFGRHGCKQFIRGKPLRYGYKLWVGATSTGYVVWYEPYQGAKSEIKDCYKTLGLGPSVVLEYTDVLFSQFALPYCLFFDNFFSTLALIDELTKRNIQATGTIRKNRINNCALNSDVEMKKNRGSFDERVTVDKNIQVVKWCDNNFVYMVSNMFGVNPLYPVTRYSQKEKTRIGVMQPNSIKKYNVSMGGVDRSDQNIGLYRTGIRGKKWYCPLIMQVLDAAEHNAWQLHRRQGGKLDHLGFRRNVAISLLQLYGSNRNNALTKRISKPSPLENVESRFDRLDHYVTEQDKQTRCRVCHKKVSTKCIKCNATLHVRCFLTYHTRE